MQPAARVGFIRSMFADSVIVAAGGLVVKGAGLVKLALAAYVFGTTDAQDAFFLAFLLPSLLSETIASAVTSSFLPAFVGLRTTARSAEAALLYRHTLSAALATMSALALLLAVASPVAIEILGSGFDAAKAGLTRRLLLCLLPMLPMIGCNLIWRGVLQSHGRFALAATAPAATPIITALILVVGAGEWGVFALAFGTVMGVLFEFVLLAVAVRPLGYTLAPGWSGTTDALRSVGSQFAPAISATALLGCVPLIDNAMAAGLGAGSVSVLAFGTKLSSVILSMGPAAIGTAILPRLSNMTARGEWESMLHKLREFSGLVMLIVIPAVVAMVVFSEPLVRLVLQKGAFTQESTLAVASVQRYSLLQIPLATLVALAFRIAASLKLNQLMLPAAAIGVSVTLVSDYVLRQLMGVAGIALAASVCQAAILVTLWLPLQRHLVSMRAGRLLE